MYCLFELLTVACLVVFVAGILFVVCAAMRLLYRAKDPAISSYPGAAVHREARRSRKKSSSAALGPGRTLFGLTAAGATRVAAARVRRGGVDIRGEAMIDFLLGCLRASYGQTLRHEISPAPTGPHSMPSDPISVPDLAGGITHPVAAPLTRAAIFLVATLNPGPNNRAAVRSFCGDLAALLRAVGFRDLEGGLSCVMGFGSERLGPALWAAAAGEAASVPGDSRRSAPRGLHAGRLAVPHPREAHGFVLRAGDADHGAHRGCRFAGRRSAGIPLLRRPRSHGLCRRNGESAGARQRSTPC